jgi:hypothetical protein
VHTKDVNLDLIQKDDFIEKIKARTARMYSVLVIYLWRATELHIYHVILITIGLFCMSKINLLNMLLLSSLIFSFLIDRHKNFKKYQIIYSGFVQIWVSILSLCSMVFQLEFIKSPLNFICNVIYLFSHIIYIFT